MKKHMTVAEGVVETIRVRRRVAHFAIVSFVQHRMERANEGASPSKLAVLRAVSAAVKNGTVVRSLDGQYELAAPPPKKKQQASARRAAPKSRVYFASGAFEKARKAVVKKFDVVKASADVVAFRWHGGPTFRLERCTPAVATRLMRPSQRKWFGESEFIALAFDDLSEALDEINTLIEAQVVIARATKAVRFLAWNKKVLSVDDVELTAGVPHAK